MVRDSSRYLMLLLISRVADAVFPRLPRWFTTALRSRPVRAQAVYFPDGSRTQNDPQLLTSSLDTPSHDHALLESLYKSVFEHRFINLKPSGKNIGISIICILKILQLSYLVI
jgi:hypothetical protein